MSVRDGDRGRVLKNQDLGSHFKMSLEPGILMSQAVFLLLIFLEKRGNDPLTLRIPIISRLVTIHIFECFAHGGVGNFNHSMQRVA
jgi:hypothetical protein